MKFSVSKKVISKFPDTKKIGINPEDVEALENLQLEDPRYDHARKVWLISFYFGV